MRKLFFIMMVIDEDSFSITIKTAIKMAFQHLTYF